MDIVAAVVLIAGGLLVALTGRLTATGRIGRNRFVGIRTRSSKADDAAWRIVHRTAQPWLIGGGVALALGGVVAAASASARPAADIAGVVALVVLVLVGTASGHAALRRDLPR
ncbi:Predicted integral membrane protein [Mycobacterium tuberculosis]|nr:Predicted integral membrane protein [Mycobacterium tuberculosis]